MKLKGFAIGILVLIVIFCVANIGALPPFFNKVVVDDVQQVTASALNPYHMILTDLKEELDELVNDYIRRGWTTLGGCSISIYEPGGDYYYSQAVVTNEYYEENIR